MKWSTVYTLLFAILVSFTLPSLNASFLNNTPAVGLDTLLEPNDQPEFLPVDEAFQFNFEQQGELLIVTWQVAPKYYLYRDKVQFVGKGAKVGEFEFPPTETVEDEYFGKSHVFRDFVTLKVPLSSVKENAEMKLRYQGCADAGLCYPPETKVFPLIPSAKAASEPPTTSSNDKPSNMSEQNQLANQLASSEFLFTMLSFFALGVGLAFTPCVFPMYPILSGIIAGRCDKMTTKYAFMLSLTYVQGMALTYSALGLVVASMGVKFQAYFQHPAVLIGLSLLFVVLSLSMFGWFELSLPAKWQEKMSNLSNQQKGGSFKGVFIMGAISGLVASPCTTAPLSGVLLYVAQSGELVVGGITLYILSLGMGLPLLILGASGGKWLPKAGNWMNQVKIIFGFMLLAVPLILLERLIDVKYIYTAGAVLVIGLCAYLYNLQLNLNNSKAKTILTFTSLVLLFASGVTIQQTWFGQNAVYVNQTADKHGFIDIKSLDDLKSQLEVAKAENKPVMVDLYADWCVACKDFENKTFTDEEVKKQMDKFLLLRADVTKNDDIDLELLEYYSVLGLPTLMFFDLESTELTQQRVTGFMDAEEFNQHLIKLL